MPLGQSKSLWHSCSAEKSKSLVQFSAEPITTPKESWFLFLGVFSKMLIMTLNNTTVLINLIEYTVSSTSFHFATTKFLTTFFCLSLPLGAGQTKRKSAT